MSVVQSPVVLLIKSPSFRHAHVAMQSEITQDVAEIDDLSKAMETSGAPLVWCAQGLFNEIVVSHATYARIVRSPRQNTRVRTADESVGRSILRLTGVS